MYGCKHFNHGDIIKCVDLKEKWKFPKVWGREPEDIKYTIGNVGVVVFDHYRNRVLVNGGSYYGDMGLWELVSEGEINLSEVL